MTLKAVHIVGAGLSGLSSGVELSLHKIPVYLYESTNSAGGRCRSFYDRNLGMNLDNGNHLLVSGNSSAFRYLDITGGNTYSKLKVLPRAIFPFFDLRSLSHWQVEIGGTMLSWLFNRFDAPPGFSMKDVMAFAQASLSRNRGKTVGDYVSKDRLSFESFWSPLSLSVMNLSAQKASMSLFLSIIRKTFIKGRKKSCPCYFINGLNDVFVDPALRWLLRRESGKIVFNSRLKSLSFDEEKNLVSKLHTSQGDIDIDADEAVVLALPAYVTGSFGIKGVSVPTEHSPILNVHFRLPERVYFPYTNSFFSAVLGGHTQWIFIKNYLVSVTISDADTKLMKLKDEEIASKIWAEVSAVLNYEFHLPNYRIIKEKRATFRQTPSSLALRPEASTVYDNLFLAGDWINTGLPATIEGAILSGRKAIKGVLRYASSVKKATGKKTGKKMGKKTGIKLD